MRFDACFVGRLTKTDNSPLVPADVENIVDRFVAELEQIDAHDIDVSTHLPTGVVRVSITIEADDLLTGQESGSALIRTAFHAAGTATPGWSIAWIEAKTIAEDDQGEGLPSELVDA